MAYKDLLRDPRWQRKRLEIFQRDNFTCTACAATDKELHVHHGYYEYGLMPWEHPDASLHTVCFECHKEWQQYTDILHLIIGSMRPVALQDLIAGVLETVDGIILRSGEEARLTPADWAKLTERFGITAEWLARIRRPMDE